jgi:peptidoglycan/xylan/chitin deacetylase (PgdA/CDA1 family)
MHTQQAAKNGVARLPVLMYHRVGTAANAAEARYCVTPTNFAAQIHALAREGFRAVPVESMVDWLNGGPALGDRDFVLTFDDGYIGVRTHALPVLRSVAWPFAVFLVTDFLGSTDKWERNDGSVAGRHRLLHAEDLDQMKTYGASFHSHGCRHLNLSRLTDAELEHELTASRAALNRLLGNSDRYIAYPYGQVDARVVTAAQRAGYKAGFSVESGFNRQDVDRYRIRRLDVAGTDSPAELLRKIRLGSNDGSLMASARYLWRRVLPLAQ